MWKYCLIAALLPGIAILWAGGAEADTVVLRDGDVLSGELLELADGTLTFLTTLSGQMMVPTDEVQSIATGDYVQVALNGAPPELGRFVVSGGATRLLRKDGALTEPLDLAAVTSAAPVPREDSLDVTLETGVDWRSGNSDYSAPFARLMLSREADDYALRTLFFLELADHDRFPRWSRAEAEWRLGPADGLYPVAGLEVERDTDAALALRGSLSLGVGKSVFASGPNVLDGDVGVGGTSEYFDAELLGREQSAGLARPIWRQDSARDEQQLHARLRLRYARTLFQNGTFEEGFKLYPSLTELGELRARSESSLLFPFTDRFKLKLDLLVDYDSDPEFHGLDQWRTSVGASFLWDF